ncbi:hypothetical protein P4C99_13195 [Pontiellaceae bacterium B1224]|nr:hypothetical protein [Pontiellaceae bacterium B1224]
MLASKKKDSTAHYYQGYGFDDVGMTVWPSKKYKFKWENLESFSTHVDIGNHQINSYATTLHFSGKKKTTLNYSTFPFKKRFPSFATSIEQFVNASEGRIIMCFRTCMIARWKEYEDTYKHAKDTCNGMPPAPSIELAKAYWVRLEIKQARQTLDSYLQQNPEDCSALILRAELEDEIYKNPKRGIVFREKALKLEPDNLDLLSYFAYLYVGRKQYRTASQVLEHMTGINPHAAHVYQAWGNYYFEQKKLKEAQNAL